MIIIKEVAPTDDNVIQLIEELNDYQISLYGIENCNLETPDSLIKNNAYMVGAFSEQHLIGIGAVKIFDLYGEVKRMYVKEQFRGHSIAQNILQELEDYVRKKNISSIYLETGNLHHAAIRFYIKQGYRQVESFGSYSPNAVSIYLAKHIFC
jgi:putative acetyltransferase